jgi:hypothetical protein
VLTLAERPPMLSPFPGMDPYLEDPGLWEDFHTTLIVAIRAEINPLLPAGYVASTDRHVWIESKKPRRRGKREPDVYVARKKSVSPAGAATAFAAPRLISLPLRERRGKPYVKIVDTRDRRVVTVVELLSPTNKKSGEHYDQYVAKREEYLASGVNMVEINLLRGGKLPPLGELEDEDVQYYILVCRATDLPQAEVWPFTVRDAFPDFPVPLGPGEQLTFNLKPCVDRAYQEARYEQEIEYAGPPLPALSKDDAAWARHLLKKHTT